MIIEVDTPQSIYDNPDYHDQQDNPLDVFADAIENYLTKQNIQQSPAWYADLDNRCWAQYRYAMIGSMNTDRWIQTLKDRMYVVLSEHQIYLDAFYALEDKTDFVSDDTTSTTEYQSEDLPDTPINEGDEYLSNRGKSKTHVEGARTPLLTLTEGYRNRMDLIGKIADGLKPVFVNRWM